MKMSSVSRQIKEQKCIYCDVVNAFSTEVGKELSNSKGPKPGDFAICFSCAQLMIVDDDLALRAPNPEEEKEAADMGLIDKIKEKIRQLPGRKLC